MIRLHTRLVAQVVLLLALVLSGCNGQTNEPPSGAFDLENPKEYGINGVYLGQGITEAMETLKPTQSEFMDGVTRESLTVEQLAQGQRDSTAIGMIRIGNGQVVLKVRAGVVTQIITGGIAQAEAQNFKSNRGLAMYDSVAKVKELYGDVAGDKELVYKGSKYQALFSIHDGKVIGMRFDPVE